jgi:hypothetical protein
MDRQAALKKISALEAELAKLKQIVSQEETKDQRIEAAKEWLISWLNENREKFTCKLGDGCIIYFLKNQWIFDLNLESKSFWCYYDIFWRKFKTDFNLQYSEIQSVVSNILLKPFNCVGFTPKMDEQEQWA